MTAATEVCARGGETRADARPLVLVGGGLANGLLAYRLRTLRPDVPVVLVEADEAPCGNHTWSFHEHDVTPAQHAWLAPLIAHAWPAYRVRFPAHARTLRSGYRSITSERLRAALADTLGAALRTGARATRVRPESVELADGTRIDAHAVIDGRGARPSRHLALGWQKFVGQEVRLARPHGVRLPIVMDATVAQHDGYRFVYVLPFSADTLLIEDTYYADGPAIAIEPVRARIAAYAAAHGWSIARVLREESGVLPITLGGDPVAFWDEAPPDGEARVARAGLRAALFHPTTGYSLPDAVRLVDRIVAALPLDAAGLHALTRAASLAHWRRQRFFRLLNRMLFGAAAPEARYAVLQRFYRLPEPLIRRFYAGAPTRLDKLRILSGRPPVPLGDAMRVLLRGEPTGVPLKGTHRA